MKKQRGIAIGWLYLIYAVVALAALSAAIAAWHSYTDGIDKKGYDRGVAAQKATDQIEFNRIEKERTAQKAEANAKYRKLQEENLALMVDRDKLKTQLETHYAADQIKTAARERELANVKLRYRTTQGAGPRCSGGGTESPGTDTASAPAAAILQLPDLVTANLRRLTRAADDLKDAYTKCYGYATQVK